MSALWKYLFKKWKKYQYSVYNGAKKMDNLPCTEKRNRSKELQRAHTIAVISISTVKDHDTAPCNKSRLLKRRVSLDTGLGARRQSGTSESSKTLLMKNKSVLCSGVEKSMPVTSKGNNCVINLVSSLPCHSKKKAAAEPIHRSTLNRIVKQISNKVKLDPQNKVRHRSASVDCSSGYYRKRITPQERPTNAPSMTVFGDTKQLMFRSPQLPRQSSSPGVHRKMSDTSLVSLPDRRRSSDRRNFDISDLFTAVEQQCIEDVKIILSSPPNDINALNGDDFSVFDVAALTNNTPISKMLMSHGAVSNILQKTNAAISKLLENLIDTEQKNVDLLKDNDKTDENCLFRYKLLKRMKAGFDQSDIPDVPQALRLAVTSNTSISLSWEEPLSHNGSIITHYKVEWSTFDDFAVLAGEAKLEDLSKLQYHVTGLETATCYYFRLAAWNMKGYGPYGSPNPPFSIPSNWRDLEGCKQRCHDKYRLLQDVFRQLQQVRSSSLPELKENCHSSCETPSLRKKISLRNLFASTPKLQKSLKRGAYLASVFCNEEKLLVTNEDQLPIIEIDETFTGPSIQADFHWLLKVSCTWEDVQSLKASMESSSIKGASVHLRCKMLHAVSLMQAAVGMRDIGQLYHRLIRDPNGCIILVTVCSVKDPKSVNLINGRWLSIAKLQRRYSLSVQNLCDARQLVLRSLPDISTYNKVNTHPLLPGLYLGYLKLQSSVDNIRVLVPHKTPNVLPFTKIRECPNVSREEWEWLRQLQSSTLEYLATPCQKSFHHDVLRACKRLLGSLDFVEKSSENHHRIYDLEVIEFSENVCFLMLLPPSEDVCRGPGQQDDLTDKPEFLSLPVQIFELIHMQTYHKDIIDLYSRLSCIIDLDHYLSQQAHRQAFSNDELSAAKERVDTLSNLQQLLEKTWKSTRWIMDLIAHARDKNIKSQLTVETLYKQKPRLTNLSHLDAHNNNVSPSLHTNCLSGSNSNSNNWRNINFYDPNFEPIKHDIQQIKSTTNSPQQKSLNSGILRVYAAYETGLAKGTSVKLHVTHKTTAREVINLVVQQLNKALLMKGKSDPVYGSDVLDQFCLVVIIGARERVLRDDYQPLHLQNPWTKGSLYVRMKSNILAALEHTQESII